jgi:hypothetical protein
MRRALAFLAFLAATPVLHATVILPAEFREIVAGSDVIAHVRIDDVRPEWAEGRRRIDSVVTARIVSSFKGDAAETVSFKVPGGELGRYRSITVGAPSFRAGDEAVLFLTSSTGAPLQVFGLNQGVFRVRLDPVSGRRIVVSPILMSDGSSTPQRVVRGTGTRRSLPLDAFGAQLRTTLAQLRGGAR